MIQSKETALETSTTSFLEKEKELQTKIEELENKVEEFNRSIALQKVYSYNASALYRQYWILSPLVIRIYAYCNIKISNYIFENWSSIFLRTKLICSMKFELLTQCCLEKLDFHYWIVDLWSKLLIWNKCTLACHSNRWFRIEVQLSISMLLHLPLGLHCYSRGLNTFLLSFNALFLSLWH